MVVHSHWHPHTHPLTHTHTHTQLGEKLTELQDQIALTQTLKADNASQAGDYQKRLAALQGLQTQCREEADELHSLLASREGELSRMITALKVAAAQIAALDGKGGATTPTAVSEEVSYMYMSI